MNNIKVHETFIDVSRDVGIGESGIYETKFKTKKELLNSLSKTHGELLHTIDVGCSKCLQDGAVGVKSDACGWVFQRESTYEDCSESYLQEIWVVVIEQCGVCGDDFVIKRLQRGQSK